MGLHSDRLLLWYFAPERLRTIATNSAFPWASQIGPKAAPRMQLNAEFSRNGINLINLILDFRRILCAFILRQDSKAVMCLHQHCIFRISFIAENLLENLSADQSEIESFCSNTIQSQIEFWRDAACWTAALKAETSIRWIVAVQREEMPGRSRPLQRTGSSGFAWFCGTCSP